MDTVTSPSVERVHRLLQPVSAAARGGSDARLGDHFDRIQSEIAKLLRAAGDGELDWRLVADQSEAVLVGEAKDLRVAVYLALAWHRLEGLPGLQRGFDLLAGLMRDYWDEVFPPLPKLAARAEVVSWLSERLEGDLPGLLARADDSALKSVWSAFDAFRTAVRGRFPERGPALGPVERSFDTLPAAKRAVFAPKIDTVPPPVATPSEGEVDDEILRPLSGASPTGEDPRLCDEFEALRVEIAKVGSIEGVDAAWPKVVMLAHAILAKKAKDLRCLVYLAVARHRVEGPHGLRDGLRALAVASERFADELHPKRPKARTGALEWLGERIELDLAKHPPTMSADDLAAIRESLARTRTALAPLCEHTNGLSRADEAIAKVKPKHVPKVVPVAKPATGPVASAAKPAMAPVIASTEGLEDIAQALLAEATARSAGGDDAVTLRLRRLALWMNLPAALPSKKYDCDSGTPQQRAELAAMAAAGQWAELLVRCEQEFLSTPFWFDLTFFAIKAAEPVLGKDAARALKSELCALSLRHPQLLGAFDRKGQWLASKDVRDWVARELTPRPPTEVVIEAAPVNVEAAKPEPAKPTPVADPDHPELPDEIQELMKARKFEDALAAGSTWIAAATGRIRFARQLSLAHACLLANAAKLAYPLFRALEGQLRRGTIADWEPRLTLACVRGYLASKMAVGVGLGPQDEHLVDELALLDPRAMTGLIR